AHDLAGMRAALTPRTRIVFVANPNNPTGTWLPAVDVKSFLSAIPRDVLLVLDEAYNEYLDPAEQADTASWIAAHPNLVISRTFSKAYGLARPPVGSRPLDAAGAALVDCCALA